MFGPQDLDNVDMYPVNGDLEEKAVYSLEQMRQRFYLNHKNYISSKEGGDLHHALLMAYGPKTAEESAVSAEKYHTSYLKQAYLTPEGETTDPRYPTDKMINHELRRIRSRIFIHVGHFFHQFEEMMPDSPADWTPAVTVYNLTPYINRYSESLYDDINVVIPKKKMKPPSVSDVAEFVYGLANHLSNPTFRDMKFNTQDRATLMSASRDETIRFILQDLPFNNAKLENKTPLLADEIMRTESDVKPVVH